jgi:hypothetical protein
MEEQLAVQGDRPEFTFCFPGNVSIPPVIAAAVIFWRRSRGQEPDA